ncbi:nucleotide-binding protein [Burkholderia sp. S171]|uniref:nucleotide-binding protein n=1 Tax=Burkholderia sp. S171 TaxID=1641860 RepID=UPI00131C92C7
MKPKIFIGSSREGIPIANAIHSNLTDDAECTVWKDGVFQPSSSTLFDLMGILRVSDFAIFVFSPDDVSIMRSAVDQVVRDNVLFELGLFIGRLGQERCFFLVPTPRKCDYLQISSGLVQPGMNLNAAIQIGRPQSIQHARRYCEL